MNSKTDPIEFAKALSDRTRQEIMKLCCCEWRSVGEMANELKVTQPTVSHHLAYLRDANLVHIRPEGRQTFYTLNQSSVASCCGVLMQNFAPDIKEPA